MTSRISTRADKRTKTENENIEKTEQENELLREIGVKDTTLVGIFKALKNRTASARGKTKKRKVSKKRKQSKKRN